MSVSGGRGECLEDGAAPAALLDVLEPHVPQLQLRLHPVEGEREREGRRKEGEGVNWSEIPALEVWSCQVSGLFATLPTIGAGYASPGIHTAHPMCTAYTRVY